MIIDMILDRKDGSEYNAREFYLYCLGESNVFHGIGDEITRAMDYGTEYDVKRALCNYIDYNEYNPAIKDYVNSVDWIS